MSSSSEAKLSSDSVAPKRALSLGVIFLTLYIDLVGFSIIFPLGPDLLSHYLTTDGHAGALGWILAQMDSLSRTLHIENNAVVLFGGVISSFFSILQFIFAPFWGAVSDRRGRRGVLLMTVSGTALGYFLWIVSGSFWMFVLSRVVSGAFSGNLSVATAAVADVTTREERSRAMGIVGAAFGLGLVTGPAIGGMTAHFNLLKNHPGWISFGINPFSVPAAIAFVLCLINLFWIYRRFKETLSDAARAESREPRLRNPLKAILSLDNAAIRRANIVAFVYSIAFVAMESCLTFLGADRFGYTAKQNTYLLAFLGVFSIITQGYIVRKLLKSLSEIRVLTFGLISSAAGLLCIGLAPNPTWLYVGVALLAIGSGLVNPSTTGLISLYATAAEQGRVLGIFRSLGSLTRAFTPILAGVVFWRFGSPSVFVCGAVLGLLSLAIASTLPKPVK
ncbi:MAG TPA: MFS transporter [Opitutaceae bacterium]|nr:MFS transporter [Opitutaceae bacterium]